MSRSKIPAVVVLVFVAVMLVLATPQLFQLLTTTEQASTGVSAPFAGLVGSIPIVLILLSGITFLAVLVVGAKRG